MSILYVSKVIPHRHLNIELECPGFVNCSESTVANYSRNMQFPV